MYDVYRSPHLERQMKDAATIEELRAVIENLTHQLSSQQRDFECFVAVAVDIAEQQERTIEALRQIAKDDGRP